MSLGLALAIFGAAIAAGLAGIGSAKGVQISGEAAAGVVGECLSWQPVSQSASLAYSPGLPRGKPLQRLFI